MQRRSQQRRRRAEQGLGHFVAEGTALECLQGYFPGFGGIDVKQGIRWPGWCPGSR